MLVFNISNTIVFMALEKDEVRVKDSKTLLMGNKTITIFGMKGTFLL